MTPRAESAARRLRDTPVVELSGRRRTRSTPMTVAEVRNLPAAVDVETAARALNMGRDKAHQLIKDGEFPITVLPLGKTYRCRLVDIAEWLGIQLEPTP